jgi:hypothetical protein
MGLWPTQADEKRLGPATTLYEPSPSPCHPERSRGICSSADPSWKCVFRQSVAKWRDLRFSPELQMTSNQATGTRPTTSSWKAKKKRRKGVSISGNLPEPENSDTIDNHVSQYGSKGRMQSQTEMCFM